MSSRMRITKSKTGHRRSQHGLKKLRLSECPNCGKPHVRHTMCENCGTYKGREVVDIEARIAKREERRKRKERELESLGMAKNKKEDEKKDPMKDRKKADKGPDKGMKEKAKQKKGPMDIFDLSRKPGDR